MHAQSRTPCAQSATDIHEVPPPSCVVGSHDACFHHGWAGQVQKLAVDSRDFARFIRDPTISREQKVVALDAVSADMKLSDITGRFMGSPPPPPPSHTHTHTTLPGAYRADLPAASFMAPAATATGCAGMHSLVSWHINCHCCFPTKPCRHP